MDWYSTTSFVTNSLMKAVHERSERQLRMLAGVVIALAVALYALRDSIKRSVSKEAAELTTMTMQQDSVRSASEAIGKSLAHEVLNDQVVGEAATTFVKDVLRQKATRDAALELVLWICEREESRDTVRGLLKTVVLQLAQDDEITAHVSSLLARAINRDDAKDATVRLATRLLADPECLEAARGLAQRLMETEEVRESISVALTDATHRTLNDEEIRKHARATVKDSLADRHVQKSAGDALWNAYKYSLGLGPRRAATKPYEAPDLKPQPQKIEPHPPLEAQPPLDPQPPPLEPAEPPPDCPEPPAQQPPGAPRDDPSALEAPSNS